MVSVLSPGCSRPILSMQICPHELRKIRLPVMGHVTLLFISFSFCSNAVSVMHYGLKYLYISVPCKKDNPCGE